METNIVPLSTAEPEAPLEKREVIQFLVSLRRLARSVDGEIDSLAEASRVDRRQAKKHRASGDRFLARNAEVLEARIAERRGDIRLWNAALSAIGSQVRALSDDIDRLIPTKELFDLLEVNPVDRNKVGPVESFRKIVFVHGLEDSATHRGSAWKEGPLFHAMSRYMMDTIQNNPALEQVVTGSLFGKGGMFEFVPTYSRNAKGQFVRNPPKLRLAEASDAT